MPLCTLEIPRVESGLSDSEEIAVCNKSLDLTLKGLDIPEWDREYRVVVSNEISEPKLTISFTAGSDEYKTGRIFNPSRKKIFETTKLIQSDPLISEFGIGSIVMEPWVNTTFISRPEDKESVLSIPPVEFISRTPEEVGEVRIKLAISPEKMNRHSVSPEVEQFLENQHFNKVGQETSSLIKEALQLPEKSDMRIEILPTHLVQTDVSIEVDFMTISKPLLSEEREFIAKSIMQILDKDSSTSEGSATIWVRQGESDSIQN